MTVLGKRKATVLPTDEAAINEIFRRHFEAHFQPLELPTSDGIASENGKGYFKGQEDEEEGEDADDKEWDGLSDQEDDDDGRDHSSTTSEASTGAAAPIEVVDHSSSSQSSKSLFMSKRELKLFMTSRPPDQTNATAKPSPSRLSSTSTSTLPEDAPSLLAQDLELRRLISESHLLASTASSSSASDRNPSKAFSQGRVHQKATDLRVQALGSKMSVLTQEKMPMLMRKGIVAAGNTREAKRRREARDNGIILETVAGAKKKARRDRTGALFRPGVGRMKGAELRLSSRDVKRIEGGRDAFGRRG